MWNPWHCRHARRSDYDGGARPDADELQGSLVRLKDIMHLAGERDSKQQDANGDEINVLRH